MKTPKFPLSIGAVVAVLVFGSPQVAIAASSPPYTGVGAKNLAEPSGGGRTIYVDDQGTNVVPVEQPWGYVEYNRITCLDTGTMPKNQPSCPEADREHPLRTVQGAVVAAKPGDVIVIRDGTYDERVGWSATPGRPDAPIHLQAYPGERVQVNGYLSLTGADYWTVRGIRFGYSGVNTTGEAIVNFFGGTGWSFVNNEVTGTHGVANLLIREETPASESQYDRISAAPQNYLVGANCVRGAAQTGTPGAMHNIYLMPTVYSQGGVVERNFVAGAPLGANIKASGSTDPDGAPRNVVIQKNTLLYGASGLVVGQRAERVETISNLIARQLNPGKYDGGVKTYDLAEAQRNSVKDSLISGYTSPIRQPWGASSTLYTKRNVMPEEVALTGSVGNCSVKASDLAVRNAYGHLAGN